MKRVLIIYTGGTIGMTRTENGYAPRAGYFRAALDAIPDLRAPEMPEWEFYELSPLLDSSNMTVREWNCIAELIAQKYDDYDGFVVLHGTDTMAYTASALSFMLDGLNKPVVLTGSQIPLCEIRSDGRDNLITALLIAGEGIVRETCLYFGGKLLRGNRATKYSADGLIAFVSPNYPSLAEAGISIKYNEAALLPRQEGGLRLQGVAAPDGVGRAPAVRRGALRLPGQQHGQKGQVIVQDHPGRQAVSPAQTAAQAAVGRLEPLLVLRRQVAVRRPHITEHQNSRTMV